MNTRRARGIELGVVFVLASALLALGPSWLTRHSFRSGTARV
jgi:hypothetical protein